MSSDTPPAAEPAPEAATDAGAGTEAAPEDQKAKFLAALQRKGNGNRGSAGGPGGDSKIHGAHGAAGGKRTFRRKSGG
ncbi:MULTISPECIES: DUF5302 domain-containing protein [Kitasatospora]|uniref:DUF5302 domain-containing protein n=1 Tax=Kitasatospora TaxID=2063 RepID=UPI0004C45D22|nr:MULTISPECIES: DUF5302 domain-containing protein [unclassified Kitasatospora]WAL73055.1 DUF5302 domain-containing protein [Kitasatospora sp. YST-16]WNW39107.1 DUF5302 domain-containing protein [Streptomyces sp. Li-HN-5-13]